MHHISNWWHSVPEWAKPVILAACIASGVALVAQGMRVFIRYIYAQILLNYWETQAKLARATGSAKDPGMIRIPDEEILKHMRWPKWMVRMAQNYKSRKEILKRL